MSTPPPSRWGPGALVVLVMVVGLVVGILLVTALPQALPPAQPPCSPPTSCPPAPPPGSASSIFAYPHLSGVLAAVALAALVALLVVYVRIWRETRSPQIVGLVLFLVALLFEAGLTSPFVFARFGGLPQGLRPFLLAGQAFEAAALLIFLYLTLQ